jgi:protoporphyrinogen oxidase
MFEDFVEGDLTGQEHPEVLVVGAGVCGLTVAERLAAAGKRVAVVEREAQPGGLARTFHYEQGNFDIGPHRFHTTDQRVLAYLDDVLGEDVRHIDRTSLMFFHGHYYHWPIHPTLHLFRLPPKMVFGVAIDLLFRLYRQREPHSFEDYILNMYGRTLYDSFFRDYTTKFLGIQPSDTHADWAKTGIDRAIIDERLQINTLTELIKSVFVRRKGTEIQFRYPAGGIDVFSQKLTARIKAAGGQVHLGAPVTGVKTEAGKITEVTAGNRTYAADRVVWTASPTALLSMAGQPQPKLGFLPLVCFNVVTRTRRGPDFQWCYFGAPDLIFSRVSRPEAFDHGMVANGGGLCVEVTAHDPALWEKPETATDRVIAGLIRVGLLRSRDDVVAMHIERVPESYPIYALGYDDQLKESAAALRPLTNLTLAGRTGTFWYNNMDHSIAMGMKLAEEV